MFQVVFIFGLDVGIVELMVVVVRCNGICMNCLCINMYDGVKSCVIVVLFYGGEIGCSYGCLGCGDCVVVCQFDVIYMNLEIGFFEVDEEKCMVCGVCVKVCLKVIIEFCVKGKKLCCVYVFCVNKDKGVVVCKVCMVSCIGCGKCVKICLFEVIIFENNFVYIDYNKCKFCCKCVEVCLQYIIIELNFFFCKFKEEMFVVEVVKIVEV